MHVHKGEIVGISGLEGSGQKELISEIFRTAMKRKGKIDLQTKVSFVSGDRQNEGVFSLWDIADNIAISSLDQVSKLYIFKKKFNNLARLWYEKLKFSANGIHDDIMNLSGGNQQKALLARGLAANAGLILLNDPTCGVDIETKQEIYKLLNEAKEQGKSIILYSTEDLEMEQCDRVYVMHEGKVVAELTYDEVSVKNIIQVSFGEKMKNSNETSTEHVVKVENTRRDGNADRNIIRSVVTNRAFMAFAVLFSLFAAICIIKPVAFSHYGITLLYSAAIPLVFVALGQMFIVISGGIDLGNGYSLGLVNVVIAFLLASHPGIGILYLVLFVLGYIALAVIIFYTKIPAIIITLGANFIWQGLALIVAPVPGGKSPDWLMTFFNYKFPLIPMPIILCIFAALLAFWIVRRSKYGMIIKGYGNNPAAISRAGWSQLVAMMVTYAISAIFIVISGFMLSAISGTGDPNAAKTYNMLSIATIVLGGCGFTGGVSSPVGTVAAALAMSSISVLLGFVNFDSNLQRAVTGLILIIALAIRLASSRIEVKA